MSFNVLTVLLNDWASTKIEIDPNYVNSSASWSLSMYVASLQRRDMRAFISQKQIKHDQLE